MDLKNIQNVKTITWAEARKKVASVNPILSTAIDALSPDKTFLLFLARYPFGKLLFDKGKIQLPIHDDLVEPLGSPIIPTAISSQLQRRPVPISMMLKNTAEVFYEMSDRIISLNLFGQGSIFGLWENLDSQPEHYVKWIWRVAIGARSIYMLPKITEIAAHKELQKKYHVHSSVPRTLYDHWQIFVEIANSKKFEQEWHAEVLFFSDKWMDTAVKDKAWKNFHNIILQEGWNQSRYWRNKITFDVVWEIFTEQLIKKNIKPNPYLVSILKHLVLVGLGVLPASAVAGNNNLSAPITGLQSVYMNDYKLKDYIPTIFVPSVFNPQNNSPIYYSLQHPAMLETALTSRNVQSIYAVIPEIAFLMEKFRQEVLQGEIKSENTPVDKFVKEIICEYFHSDANADENSNIRHTSDLAKEDSQLLAMPKNDGKRKFAETGHFIRGCVRFKARKF